MRGRATTILPASKRMKTHCFTHESTSVWKECYTIQQTTVTYQNTSQFLDVSSGILKSHKSSALNFLSPILPHFILIFLFFFSCFEVTFKNDVKRDFCSPLSLYT